MALAPAPDPVAVVTGGTGGIGSAICTTFASAGFNVVVGYRNSGERAALLAASLPRRGMRVPGHIAERAPVTDSPSLALLAARVTERYGRCDVLVNCAAITRFVAHDNLDGLDDALIDDILSTNVRGAFAALRAFVPLLRRSSLPGGGVVVNVSSIASRIAMGSNVMYCASKAALDNMTRSLARALAPEIRVVSVSPGLVDTDFIQSLDLGWRNEQVARTPLGRLAQPSEVAAAVLCAVRELTFTTGSILDVDGGRPLN